MDLNKLIIKIYSDVDKNPEIIYCFSHNESNIKCMADKINNLNLNSEVYILGNSKPVSYILDFKNNFKIYKDHNIFVKPITCPDLPMINTKVESDLIIDWAIKNNIKKIGICSPPYHLLRAFMTLVTSSIVKNYNISIFPYSGMIDDWNKIVVCHQGTHKESFSDMIDFEIERINKYIKKGDILTYKYILEYMDKRDFLML